METKEIAKTIQRLLSITETGLAFSRDEFDRERYLELRQLLGRLLADWSDLDGKELAELLRPTDFYATPLTKQTFPSRTSKARTSIKGVA